MCEILLHYQYFLFTRNIKQIILNDNFAIKLIIIYVVFLDMSSPEGVTIDWINRVLYWTDSGKHTIESINLDGTERKLVISKGLIEPRGLAVHPHIRLLPFFCFTNITDILGSNTKKFRKT